MPDVNLHCPKLSVLVIIIIPRYLKLRIHLRVASEPDCLSLDSKFPQHRPRIFPKLILFCSSREQTSRRESFHPFAIVFIVSVLDHLLISSGYLAQIAQCQSM